MLLLIYSSCRGRNTVRRLDGTVFFLSGGSGLDGMPQMVRCGEMNLSERGILGIDPDESLNCAKTVIFVMSSRMGSAQEQRA